MWITMQQWKVTSVRSLETDSKAVKQNKSLLLALVSGSAPDLSASIYEYSQSANWLMRLNTDHQKTPS